MKQKPRNQIAVLGGALSAIAGSSLLLSAGLGASRHYFLVGAALVCAVLLVLILAARKRRPNQPL